VCPPLRIHENIFQNPRNFNVSLTYRLKGFSYIWKVIIKQIKMKTHQENPDPAKQLEQLKKLIASKNNEVVIYYIHETVYGPIRGLHFILSNPDPVKLDQYLKQVSSEVSYKLWETLGLVVKPMVSPDFVPEDFEESPKKFNNLESAEEYILAKVKTAPYKDPFYYRKGIL